MVSERKKMNRNINVRSGAITVAVMALAILTALVTKAAASNPEATGPNPSPQSYLAGYPAPPSAPPAMETAQASQLQNVQPGYVPPPPTQGAPRQTLTLPQVAPQPSSETAVELPESQGQKGSLEVPKAPIERQPQTTVGRIPVTVTDGSAFRHKPSILQSEAPDSLIGECALRW